MTKAELEVENERLMDLNERLGLIIARLDPQRFPGVFFICGAGGDRDANGLPERIFVCPAYGCGWSETYTRTDEIGPTAE